MDETANYIADFLSIDNVQLETIVLQEMNRNDLRPSIGLELGKLLGLLIRLMGAQRVLEMGTSLGYSTIWLAQALQTTGGKLVSIEYKDDLFEETKTNIAHAGFGSICVRSRSLVIAMNSTVGRFPM